MGKKEKKMITLSEVDHKLQFINTVAVIGNISPTILRSKLTKIEVFLLDETISNPGLNVKLNLESEMLNHFLNAAKKGFCIQLNEIKVTKNEGEVYGEVQDEEEIALYDDSRPLKWYPGEKLTTVTDAVKQKILRLLKWKKKSFSDIDVVPENNEIKTRRSGKTICDEKILSSKSSKQISSPMPNLDSPVSLSTRTKKSIPNNQEDHLSEAVKNTKTSNKLPSHCKINKSLSLTKLNKSLGTTSFKKSLSSTKLNESPPQSSLNKANISNSRTNLAKRAEEIEENTEHDSPKLTRSTRSASTPNLKSNKIITTTDKKRNASASGNNVEKMNSTNFEPDCEIPTKVNSKRGNTNYTKEEKVHNSKIRTRQTINKAEASSTSHTENHHDIDRNSPKSTDKNTKSENSKNKDLSNKIPDDLLASGHTTKTNNQEKKIHRSNLLSIKTKGDNSEVGSPSRKKVCLTSASDNSSDKSGTTGSFTPNESSPRTNRKCSFLALKKNPTLNSSDSSISDNSVQSLNKISSKESLKRPKRHFNQTQTCTQSVSIPSKLRKLDLEGSDKSENFKSSQNNILSKSDNEKIAKTPTEVIKSVPERKLNRKCTDNKEKEINTSNDDISHKRVVETIQSNNTEIISPSQKRKKIEEIEDKTSPKTRKQVSNQPELNKDPLIKKTRNSLVGSIQNNKESGNRGIYETYLKPLTKKLNFSCVENITDISLCELEEVDVPDKFDLNCKVVSEFVIVEEGIQVVTVQDGTTCKCGTLKIPFGNSWDTVSKEILKNPVVEKNSQCIDIIIFDYFRLDFPIKADKYFRINNIMSIKFQLKNDPRKEKKLKEFFFCVEGQNAFIKRLTPQQIKELDEVIPLETQNKTLRNVSSGKVNAEKSIKHLSDLDLSSSQNMSSPNILMCGEKSPMKLKPQTSPENKDDEFKQSTNISNKFEIENLKARSPEKAKREIHTNSETVGDKIKSIERPKVKGNITSSSDETLMEETPPLLREINEIMREESLLGLPLTVSEDVHLKNSGSEVTFSQFCQEAKLKGDNFRTSTQTVEPDDVCPIENSVCDIPKNTAPENNEAPPEEPSEMEPLVLCPSNSSAGSADSASPEKENTPQNSNGLQQCSLSLLDDVQLKQMSDVKLNDSENRGVVNDNISDLSNSSSVKVISSSSSVEIDMEVQVSKNFSNNISDVNKITKVGFTSTTSHKLKDKSNAEQRSSLSKSLAEKDNQSEGVIDLESFKEKDSKKVSNNGDIIVDSDNSSNSSLLITKCNTQVQPTTPSNAGASVNNDPIVQDLEQRIQLIPERYFYKSSTNVSKLTEVEINEIYDEENSPVKYLSYCHNRHLPVLTLDTIKKIQNTNSLTLTVTFVSTSPVFTDLWKEKAIKARCPTCEKLYDVYNIANNKSNEDACATSAILVGSHIVCPESECCNQILGKPEFHFSVQMKLTDGTLLTALLAGEHAEEVFGCSASDAMRDENTLTRVADTLERISSRIGNKRPTKVVVKRERICDPESGPLFLTHIAV